MVNGKVGTGVPELKRHALGVGAKVNENRVRKGLLPRPVRCVIIGYPNVGKSALINRLVNKRAVKSANTPGVTRNMRWVKISNEIELLDMPGVIPAKLDKDEEGLIGMKLAVCDDIGHASYDSVVVAAGLIEVCREAYAQYPWAVPVKAVVERYGVGIGSAEESTPEEVIYAIADSKFNGDVNLAARKVLTDFRNGMWGKSLLEFPPRR
mmetsp:Transcript_1380/g.3755  ORF Transcript_1380/g.3755 Transcript_1380/m.3755 type:complete len:209 (+) Transcript_1380:3-629(+)